MKSSHIKKLISICLTALIVIASLNIPGSGVYAAGEEIDITLSDSVKYVWSGDTITGGDESYTISADNMYKISVEGNASLELSSDMENFRAVTSLTVNSEGTGEDAPLFIDSGVDINLGCLGSFNRIENAGTVHMTSFTPTGIFTNVGFGTVEAQYMELNVDNVAGSGGTFIVSSGGTINISGFYGGDTQPFSLELPYNATVTSEGGSFNVVIDRASGYQSEEVELSGAHSGQKVSDIFPDDVLEPIYFDIRIGESEEEPYTVYVGTDPQDTFEIEVYSEEHEYEISLDELGGDIDYAYCDDSHGDTDWILGLPDSSITGSLGSYRLRATFDGNSVYSSAEDDIFFDVEFLPLDECEYAEGEKYLALSGVYNGKYAKDTVTLTPASGWQAKDSYGGSEFASSVSLDYDKMFPADNGRNFNAGLGFYLKRSDGAETDYVNYASFHLDNFTEIVFDPDPPEITGTPKVDGRTVALNDGAVLVGNVLSFTVEDANLDEVYINDPDNSFPVEDGKAEIILESEPGSDGKYELVATDLSTNELQLSFTFSNKKIVPEASVSIKDVTVGTDYSPVLVTDSDGKNDAVFEYKKVTDPDSAYTTTKPVAGGEYKVRATIPETAYYEEAVCESTFKIIRLTPTNATVIVPDTVAGTDYDPVLTTDSDGKDKAVFEYKKSGEDDKTYTDTKPKAWGTYTIKATVPQTDNYESISCTSEFTISSKPLGESTVKVADTIVGTDYDPVLSTDSDGKDRAVFDYKPVDADESAYTTEKPKAAGTYMVRATIPATDNYQAVVCTSTFTISKRTAETLNINIADVFVGQSYAPSVDTDSDGKEKTYFEYKADGTGDEYFTKDKPTKAGAYVIRATVPETETYYTATATKTFAIKRYTTDASVSQVDVYAGTVYTPVVTTKSDGKNSAVFQYKPYGANDNQYSSLRPVTAGKFEVRAIIPATDTYEEVTCKTSFTVRYLEIQGNAFSPTGTKGKNGWYKSDVYLQAPANFGISNSFNGTYTNSIMYKPGMKFIYLRRKSDGALTDAIRFTATYKIDKVGPEFSDPRSVLSSKGSKTVSGGIYADDYVLVVMDDYLAKVTVDGKTVKVVNGRARVEVDAENGIKQVNITAEDQAGNVSRMSFKLMAEWLKNKHIPAKKLLPLSSSEEYHLDSGNWTVNGDPTTYKGGGSVFVRSTGKYTFDKE